MRKCLWIVAWAIQFLGKSIFVTTFADISTNGTYQCIYGNSTINGSQICDGKFNCMYSIEDECLMNCKYSCFCPTLYEICGDRFCEVESSEDCLPCTDRQSLYKLSQMCDGNFDCIDKSDEEYCSEKFFCKNGKEILERLTCDTRDDCGDTSDECGCVNTFTCGNSKCIPTTLTCDGKNNCGDHTDECGCNSKHKYMCSSGACVAAEAFCDGVVDCDDGSDEITTSNIVGQPNIVFCNNVKNSVDKTCLLKQDSWLCDMSIHCVNRTDECTPDCSAQSFWCDGGRCLKVEAFCNGVKDCEDGTDEAEYNETSSINAISCVSKFHNKMCALDANHPWVCDSLSHCVNNTDQCTPGCSQSYHCQSGECIDRNLLCDGPEDCADGSDERVRSNESDIFLCTRTRDAVTRTCLLPLSITMDNSSDCDRNTDVIDEHKVAAWSNITSNSTNPDIDPYDYKQFRCIGERLYIPGENLCDYKFNCRQLSDECMCEESPKICQNICYKLNPLDGVNSPCSTCKIGELECQGKCVNRSKICDDVKDCLNGEDEEFCASAITCMSGFREECVPKFQFQCEPDPQVTLNNNSHAHQCDEKPQCKTFEDECNNDCLKKNGKLPEFCSHISGGNYMLLDGYYSCDEDGVYLEGPQVCDGHTFDCPNGKDEQNCPDRIYCNSSHFEADRSVKGITIHIAPYQICDGKIDCENREDEKGCPDRYYCEGGKPYFVPLRFVMDGKEDCQNGSDECPPNSFNKSVFSSRELMIRDPILRYFIWLMGGLSIVGNLAVLVETIYDLVLAQDRFKNKRPFAKVNHVLVINLALADLLMGIYLIVLGSEAASKSGSYCLADKLWRTSSTCSFLGVLTIVSSMTSVLILLILTSYRLYGVVRPYKCREVNYIVALVFAAFAWMTSFALAVLPVTILSNRYTSHLWIKHNPYFRHDVANKSALLKFVKKLPLFYNHDVGKEQIDESKIDDTWTSIKTMIKSVFGDDAIKGEFGYYSHVSLCMPKLYVTMDDTAWEHSMIIIVFNCVAFTYIVGAYAYIFIQSIFNMKATNSKRQKSMFRRITYLVVTDLACWLPICAMAFMNFAGYEIPENAYAISAVILLPINSALNPFLYSNAVQRCCIYFITCGKKKGPALETSHRKHTDSKDGRWTDRSKSVLNSRDISLRKVEDKNSDLQELRYQKPHSRVLSNEDEDQNIKKSLMTKSISKV